MTPKEALRLCSLLSSRNPQTKPLYASQWRNIDFGVFELPESKRALVFSGLQCFSSLPTLNFGLRKTSDGGVITDLASGIHVIRDELVLANPIWKSMDYVIGYSLGGVLAYYYAYYYDRGASVKTFGSPRPGDETFNNSYDRVLRTKTERFYLPKDLVVHIPGFKFWHVGRPKNLENNAAFDSIEVWEKTIGGFLPDSPWLIWAWYPIMALYWLLIRFGLIPNWHAFDMYQRFAESKENA